MGKKLRRLMSQLTAIGLALILLLPAAAGSLQATEETGLINRFNVVIVLDASKSMDYTDPDDLRYEAIQKFINYLAEKGNYLGGVVFAQDVAVSSDLNLITDQSGKDKVVEMLESEESLSFTNIGDGLLTATQMLENGGNEDLPSVIIFLSDGNTEMPSDELLTESLDNKAEAIQEARDNGIKIHSVCLNVDSTADSSEMKQISDATSGEFVEITSADGFSEALDSFYAKIFGTTPTEIVGTFDENGELKTEIDVPGFGVEEVNIEIDGKVSDVKLLDPDGKNAEIKVVESDTFSNIKLTDVSGGTWTLVTKGVAGDQIKIKILYNTNLTVSLSVDPDSLITGTEDDTVFTARLVVSNQESTSRDQLDGYSAVLVQKDVYDTEIATYPMEAEDGAFVYTARLDEGSYKFEARVTGYNLEKTSETIGPVKVVEGRGPDTKYVNNPPEAKENPVNETVYIWPFKGGQLSLDLSTLTTDPEDQKITYTVASSSFLEGTDYTIKDDILTMDHFSLSKGSFDILATDEEGAQTTIQVNVKTYNVGIMALIGIAIVALIVLIIIGIIIYRLTLIPFNGSVTVRTNLNGQISGNTVRKKRGKMKLTAFGLGPTPLNYNKCYFQASGKGYITLHTNIPVFVNGVETKKARISSGVQTVVTFKGAPGRMDIRYDEVRRSGRRR